MEHSERLLHAKGRNGIDTISQKTFWIRELLRDVVLVLVDSGMRPGTEILKLKWCNLSVVEQDKSAILIKQMAKQSADSQKQIAELLEQNRLLMERLLEKGK